MKGHTFLDCARHERNPAALPADDTLSLDAGKKETIELQSKRFGWLQVIEGSLLLNNDLLESGDGVAIDPETKIELVAKNASRLLFFDLK